MSLKQRLEEERRLRREGIAARKPAAAGQCPRPGRTGGLWGVPASLPACHPSLSFSEPGTQTRTHARTHALPIFLSFDNYFFPARSYFIFTASFPPPQEVQTALPTPHRASYLGWGSRNPAPGALRSGLPRSLRLRSGRPPPAFPAPRCGVSACRRGASLR